MAGQIRRNKLGPRGQWGEHVAQFTTIDIRAAVNSHYSCAI